MITNDLLLPSVYHLQRTGLVGSIAVCAQHAATLQSLVENAEFAQAFPGQQFTPYPPLTESPTAKFPSLYKVVLSALPPRQVVVVALPDHLHYDVVKAALAANQHVLCVKPFVQHYAQAWELEREALARGLFIGVEYHKRFDRRALIAKRDYALGKFGAFVMGEARLMEPYSYRNSKFQNWFTCDVTDPFTYVGCHYVDLVQFITGLKPVSVSVAGVKGKFPNGNEGYLWAHGRLMYENGAILSVSNGLGYPDDGAGSNDQGLTMYCEGHGRTGMIAHNDQSRGVAHSYLEGSGPGGTRYNYINPDFFRLVPWEGAGCKPVGYGYDSVAAILGTIHQIEAEVAGLDETASLEQRRALIREADARGILATPANSSTNELVIEAARRSILGGGRNMRISYGAHPQVEEEE